jgi:hypothetical protein
VEANSTGGQGSRRAVAPSDDDDDDERGNGENYINHVVDFRIFNSYNRLKESIRTV